MSDLLVVDRVSKSFKGLKALDEISINIKPGHIYGIIGPNGSGKTTLFNIITGVLKPDSGQVIFDGRRIDVLEPNSIYNLGITRSFQLPTLWLNMSVAENLMLPPKQQVGENLRKAFFKKAWETQDMQLSDMVWQTLETLKLKQVALNKSSEISGGQMKLIELGRTMMSNPKLVLLDEPTAGVNPALALEIFKIIKEIKQSMGLTYVIIEHRYDMLFANADYIYLLNEGKVVSEGSPEKVINDPVLAEVYLGA
ncbi:MAG: ABC transporter ATP-binding protein [Candidatus Caldarchaeum sp.]|nr:ABC transporter ATP-binding protein [Candidatus Caldarchaeales archaeon]